MNRMHRCNALFIIRILALICLAMLTAKSDASPRGGARDCATRLPGRASEWTAQEQWVWQRICAGQVADLQAFGGTDEPADALHWPEKRTLSARFIETAMADERLRSAIPYRGVEIRGARFSDVVDFESARLHVPLTLSHCQFDKALRLSQAIVDGQLSIDRSNFEGDIDMSGIKTFTSLVLDGVSATHTVNLVDADIGGQLSLNDAKIKGPFKAGSAKVAKGLYATGSAFSEFSLTEASIGGELVIRNSVFDGPASFDAAQVGQSAYLIQKTTFLKDVTFSATHVAGQFDMSTAQIDGPIRMENLSVGRSLFMRDISIKTRASMTYLSVGGNLELSSGSFATLDLTGAHIGQGLRLGSKLRAAPHWQDGAQLILHNASARDIQDRMTCPKDQNWTECVDGWPKKLDLVGFTYENPSALDADKYSDLSLRSSEWWIGWLDRQSGFHPQTYAQVARMLSKINQDDKVIDVLYAEKTREREHAHGIDRVLLTLHQIFVGYGFRTSYALWWAIVFIFLGAVILRVSGEGKRAGIPLGVAYSLDMLLPIIRLREAHYDIDLQGRTRYYFYFHKIMGYVLASFLIAGLAGLVNTTGK
ncbi:hypothetical protein M0D69_16910 [Caballeronia sp. SEWSISQ10-4 2]|uniref:hypothetical protein n=1 Tax=Caballeronia sp. SEWSISQ10-4 2 TaxID=2937438 RepID=UPI002656169E|nr:hypothetical protein [Caballeronia sp. SEWSISQ10-4 2]MDN7179638.1 hypothetical protein [Caballeronia sp. SEWSISQ10-4 2]